jgi:predicted deacylase
MSFSTGTGPGGGIAAIRPTVQMVADLVRVRAVHEGAETQSVASFDATTWPTDADVERLIDQAANAIWTQVPGSLAEPWPPAAQHLAALYAAILVETSYFREQLTDDMVQMYRDLLTSGIKGLGASVSSSETVPSRHVDTVVMRSVMTAPYEYLLGLDLPGLP